MGAIILFSFVLFVMGGVTAYVGDRLGSYIGKKRHSSFGLRPRHTAMLWTVVSGGGIAVGTLLLLLVWDNTVKTALLQGPQIVATNTLLEQQNRALTRRNDITEAMAKANDAKAAQAQAQAVQAQGALRATLTDLRTAKSALAVSQNLLALRQVQLGVAQKGLGSTRSELHQAQARVREARAGVAEARRQLLVASDQVALAQRSVLQLARAGDRLTERNFALSEQNKQQQTQLVSSQGQTVIYRKGEEVGRTVVSANQPAEAIRRELTVFLDGLSQQARRRGALGNEALPAVLVIARTLPPNTSLPDAENAALDALSQNIAAQASRMPSVVVVAEAQVNTFGGEQVKLALHPYDNALVFAKGTEIATEAIDGTQTEDVILKRLQQFLTTRVRAAALHEGIIPLRDPQSGEPLVGQPIDSPTWISLIKQIQEVGPDAQVTAIAASDTYSSDLLRLELRVLPLDSPSAPPAANTGAKPRAQ